jgi:hypothetical protein
METDAKVKQAMTAEEWANPNEVFSGYLDVGLGVVDIRLGEPAGIRDAVRERHALAALCLHGQPFGFQARDVAALRDLLRGLQEVGVHFVADQAEIVSDLADRIAALLPPEEQ